MTEQEEKALDEKVNNLRSKEANILNMPVHNKKEWATKNQKLARMYKAFHKACLDYGDISNDGYGLAWAEYLYLSGIVNDPVKVANVRDSMTADEIPLTKPKYLSKQDLQELSNDYVYL